MVPECSLTNCDAKFENIMTDCRQLDLFLYKYCFFFPLFCQHSARFVLCFRMFLQLRWTITNLQNPNKASYDDFLLKLEPVKQIQKGKAESEGDKKLPPSPPRLPLSFPSIAYCILLTGLANNVCLRS